MVRDAELRSEAQRANRGGFLGEATFLSQLTRGLGEHRRLHQSGLEQSSNNLAVYNIIQAYNAAPCVVEIYFQ